MKRKAIGAGVYIGEDRRFWVRPWINTRRTWRLLEAKTRRSAYTEAAGAAWNSAADLFSELAKLYSDADCPNKKLEGRPESFCTDERIRLKSLDKYFGKMSAAEIRLSHIPAYARWRMRQKGRGTKQRATDKDLQTLSNVMNYGVAIGQLELNYVRSGRPRYRKFEDVKHCRESAPENADVIHQIADNLFDGVKSESSGWLLLFSMFTGCRTSELRRLRIDAKNDSQPGFIRYSDGLPDFCGMKVRGYLYLGRRSKHGMNPWSAIFPEFAQMLECFQRWHKQRFPGNMYFFPGMFAGQPINPKGLGHALTRLCKELSLPHIMPHGLRSYFATKLHREGARDEDIAAAIGDKTVALVQNTYRAAPGGARLNWTPKEGLAAWLRWKSAQSKIVNLK